MNVGVTNAEKSILSFSNFTESAFASIENAEIIDFYIQWFTLSNKLADFVYKTNLRPICISENDQSTVPAFNIKSH